MTERPSRPPVAWTQEGHDRWNAAASQEVSRLFNLLKRKEIDWNDMNQKSLEELDQVIMGRLKALRDKEDCPESMMYFAWQVQKFYEARKAQVTLGGQMDQDVEVVYRRVMSSFDVSWCYRLAIKKQDPLTGWIPDLDEKIGLRLEAMHKDRATAYLAILKERHLA